MVLRSSMATPSWMASSRRKASTARYTRFFSIGSLDNESLPATRRAMPGARVDLRRSSSLRLMVWKMVRSSWKPSGRLPKISRRELILAKAGRRTSGIAASGLHRFGSGFLRHAMPGLADFLFDLGDFFRLDVGGQDAFPFGERFFPLGGSLLGGGGIVVNVAQMSVNGRIMAFAIESFAESGFGVGELVLLVVDPAEAIEIGAVVRIFGEGALDEGLRFVETNAQVAEHVSVIVEDGSALGIDVESFLELDLGFVKHFLAFVDGAKEEPHHFVIARRAGDGFGGASRLFGVFVTASAFVNLRDIQVGVAVGSVTGKLGAQEFHGIIRLRGFAEKQGVIGSDFRIFGIFCDCFFAGRDGLGEVFGHAVGIHDQQARAAVLVVAEMAQFFIGVYGGAVILRVAVELAELLIEDGEETLARGHGSGLRFDFGDRLGEHANGIVETSLRLVEQGFVVHDVEAAGRILARLDEGVLGFVHLVQFAVNLAEAEIDIGVVGDQFGKTLIDGQGFWILLFGHEGLAEAALVADFARFEVGGFAIGFFGFGKVLGLGVRIAEQVEQCGRRGFGGDAFQQSNRFAGFAFVEKKLSELFEAGFVVGVVFQQAAKHFFCFFVLILQAIEARQPKSGLGVVGVQTDDFLELFDGAIDGFGLAGGFAGVAEATQVDVAEKTASLGIVGIALEKSLGFDFGFVDALGLPIHFGQSLPDDGGLGVERVSLFVKVDGLRGVVAAAGGLVLLLGDVAHGVVIVGFGATAGRGGRRLLTARVRSGRGLGSRGGRVGCGLRQSQA